MQNLNIWKAKIRYEYVDEFPTSNFSPAYFTRSLLKFNLDHLRNIAIDWRSIFTWAEFFNHERRENRI